MTRPPGGAGFAQFFPAAPRAVRDRMTEREKAERAKKQLHELPEASSPSSQPISHPNPPRLDRADAGGRTSQDAPFSDASQPQTDDNESARGDTPNGTRSASSHASAVSSVFSNSARQAAPAAQPPAAVTTPLTSLDSPLYTGAMSASKPRPTPTNPNSHDATPRATSQGPDLTPHPSTQDTWAPPDRIPARDPTRQVQGLRCTYDPLRDRSLDKHAKRDAKPKFKEFGSVRHIYDTIPPTLKGGASSLCSVSSV